MCVNCKKKPLTPGTNRIRFLYGRYTKNTANRVQHRFYPFFLTNLIHRLTHPSLHQLRSPPCAGNSVRRETPNAEGSEVSRSHPRTSLSNLPLLSPGRPPPASHHYRVLPLLSLLSYPSPASSRHAHGHRQQLCRRRRQPQPHAAAARDRDSDQAAADPAPGTAANAGRVTSTSTSRSGHSGTISGGDACTPAIIVPALRHEHREDPSAAARAPRCPSRDPCTGAPSSTSCIADTRSSDARAGTVDSGVCLAGTSYVRCGAGSFVAGHATRRSTK